MKTQDYMVLIEKAAEQSTNNMYNNTLNRVSAYVQQSVCNSPVPVTINMRLMQRTAHNYHTMLTSMT